MLGWTCKYFAGVINDCLFFIEAKNQNVNILETSREDIASLEGFLLSETEVQEAFLVWCFLG